MNRRHTDTSDRGDTLVEVLIALVVMGITSAALLGGFATAISAAGEHQKLASLSSALTSYQDELRASILSPTSHAFVACATPSSYSSLTSATPSGITGTITSVTYWSGTAWTSTCTSTSPPEPELITVTLTGATASMSSSFGVSDPLYLPGSSS